MNTLLFKNFREYWYYVKSLSTSQRDQIFNSLPDRQRRIIQESYDKQGWKDVFMRDNVNKLVDKIKKDSSYDLINIRCRVIGGKSVYLPKKFWRHVQKELGAYDEEDVYFVIGDIETTVCDKNNDVVLLTSSK